MAYAEKISDTTYKLIVCNGYDCKGKKITQKENSQIQ